MSAVTHYSEANDPKRFLCGKKVKGGNEWTRNASLVECSGCVQKLKETKPMTVKELAEQWKGRGDDCGRLARAVLALPEVGLKYYSCCVKHMGMPWTIQVSSPLPRQQVCPICEREAALPSPQKATE